MDETTKKEALDRLNSLWSFETDRVYMLVALARSKENDAVNATSQPTMRKICEDWTEVEEKMEQLEHAAARHEEYYRLYAVVNGRDAKKAMRVLQHELIEWTHHIDKNADDTRHKRIDHEWKSILHSKECRDEKRFMWDVDDPSEEARATMEELLWGKTIDYCKTPNGWHFVTVPFNFTELDIPEDIEVERKNDDMFFLGFL